MTTYGVHKITGKKCATCSYWQGERQIEFVAYKPSYIKALAGSFDCIANSSRKPTAGTTCLKWRIWEKIS